MSIGRENYERSIIPLPSNISRFSRGTVSPKVVSEQLGHTSTAFTLDVYSHVLPHMQDDAAAKVEAALLGT
jgi:integrase